MITWQSHSNAHQIDPDARLSDQQAALVSRSTEELSQ